MSRLGDALRGLMAVLGGVLLVVGVPWVLTVLVGAPWPTAIPNWPVVRRHLLEGNVPSAFVLKSLAVAAWLVWSQMMLALGTESIAAARGRLARRAPVLPGIQIFAAKLVASALLLLSLFSSPKGAAALPLSAVTELSPLDGAHDFDASSSGSSIEAVALGGELLELRGSTGVGQSLADQTTPQENLVYVAETGDSWWRVAEHLTGDGLRWRELRDLNVGHEVAPGTVLAAGSEELDSGWKLLVPSDVSPSLLTAETASEPADYEVKPGDTLWEIAQDHLGDANRWTEVFELSEGLEQNNGRTIEDPDVIWPGDVVRIPAESAQSPETEIKAPVEPVRQVPDSQPSAQEVPSAPTQVSPSEPMQMTPSEQRQATPSEQTQNPPDEQDDADGRDLAAVVASLSLGSGALLSCVGTIGLLRRVRLLRRSNIGSNAVPAPPPLELVDIETLLRGRNDRQKMSQLRGLAASLAHHPTPEFLRLHPNRAEAVVDDSMGSALDPSPAPWLPAPVADGASLPEGRRALALLGPSFDSVTSPGGRNDPHNDGESKESKFGSEHEEPWLMPTLVTIGRNLFANLEALGVVRLEGSAEDVSALVRSMILELATGPLEPDRRRVAQVRVSFSIPGTEVHPNVSCGPLTRIETELASWIEQAELAIAAAQAESIWSLRAHNPEALPPSVVLIVGESELAQDPVLVEFVDRARNRRLPLSVVVVADPTRQVVETNVTIRLSDDRAEVLPHGLIAGRHGLDSEVVIGVEALIDHARRAPLIPRPEVQWDLHCDFDPQASTGNARSSQIDVETVIPNPSEAQTEQAIRADPGLLIRVLGPVEIVGGEPELLAEVGDPTLLRSEMTAGKSAQALAADQEAETSILAYLALSGPSKLGRIADAVFPGDDDAPQRVELILSDLGRRLGPLLAATDQGQYRLRSTVTDLGTARRLITQAKGAQRPRAMNLLRTALSEVRGRPFEGADPRLWQWLEDHKAAVKTQASSLLLDACFDLCDMAWEADDPALADWACEVAAEIEPLQETIAARRAQILIESGRGSEAADVVQTWETLVSRTSGRPAPHGPRNVLSASERASLTVEKEHVG